MGRITRFSILLCTMLYFCSAWCMAHEATDFDSLLNACKAELYHNPSASANKAEAIIRHYALSDGKNDILAEAKLLLADAQKLIGNYDSSISNLYDALDDCNDDNQKLKGRIYLEMGFVYSRLFDFKKALSYCNQATAILKAKGDSIILADCYNTLGIVYCNAEEYVEAEHYFKLALSMNRKFGNETAIAANLNNLSLYKGDLQEKIKYINEAIAINTKLSKLWSLGENYNNKGRQYFFAGKHKEALDTLEIAKKYAEQVGSKELLCDNYEYYSMVYSALKNYQKAYEYQKKREALSNELQSAEKLRVIEESIMQKRLEKKAHEDMIREQAYRIERLRHRSTILICAIIILLIATALVISIQKRKKNHLIMHKQYLLEQSQRELAELKIQQQQNELLSVTEQRDLSKHDVTTLSVFINSRNELLEKIRDKIKEGMNMDERNLKQHLKKVNLFIRQSQDIVKTNSTISGKISENNTEFIDNLKKLHPDLTQGEVNLAAMLRINLSTKDIAQLTDTLPKTVNMNRYRLRKALNLSKEIDLVDYLKNI